MQNIAVFQDSIVVKHTAIAVGSTSGTGRTVASLLQSDHHVAAGGSTDNMPWASNNTESFHLQS